MQEVPIYSNNWILVNFIFVLQYQRLCPLVIIYFILRVTPFLIRSVMQ